MSVSVSRSSAFRCDAVLPPRAELEERLDRARHGAGVPRGCSEPRRRIPPVPSAGGTSPRAGVRRPDIVHRVRRPCDAGAAPRSMAAARQAAPVDNVIERAGVLRRGSGPRVALGPRVGPCRRLPARASMRPPGLPRPRSARSGSVSPRKVAGLADDRPHTRYAARLGCRGCGLPAAPSARPAFDTAREQAVQAAGDVLATAAEGVAR